MSEEVKISLIITSAEFDINFITSAIGLKPTNTWKKGSIPRKGAAPKGYNLWSYSVEYESFDLERCMKLFLNEIEPYKERVIEVCKNNNLDTEIGCYYFSKEQSPIIHFDNATLALIVDLNAELDVDVYC